MVHPLRHLVMDGPWVRLFWRELRRGAVYVVAVWLSLL